MDFIGKWGVCKNCFNDLICSEDLNLFKQVYTSNIFFKCIDQDQNYITLTTDGQNRFKVKPQLFMISPQIGDHVKLIKHPKSEAIIYDIKWHIKDSCSMFFLNIDGKKKSKRYFMHDFLF